MATAPATVAICDRGDCPAPARRTLVLHDQDFHFCGHHAVELVHTIEALDVQTGAVDAGATAGPRLLDPTLVIATT